jgi:hypothetical protein
MLDMIFMRSLLGPSHPAAKPNSITSIDQIRSIDQTNRMVRMHLIVILTHPILQLNKHAFLAHHADYVLLLVAAPINTIQYCSSSCCYYYYYCSVAAAAAACWNSAAMLPSLMLPNLPSPLLVRPCIMMLLLLLMVLILIILFKNSTTPAAYVGATV